MVHIECIENEKCLILHGVGHCGWGPKGKDLICAAVTTLFYTAQEEANRMESAGELTEHPDIYLASGESFIRICPAADAREEARTVFRTLCSGFRVLASSFPSAVQISISETAKAEKYTEVAPT